MADIPKYKYTIDTETTDVIKDGVVPDVRSIAISRVDQDGNKTFFAALTKPTETSAAGSTYGWVGEAEKAAENSHRIRWAEANEFGEEKSKIIDGLDNFFESGTDHSIDGHNIKDFDMPVMEKFLGDSEKGKSVLSKMSGYKQLDALPDIVGLRGKAVSGKFDNKLSSISAQIGVKPSADSSITGKYRAFLDSNPNKLMSHDASVDVEASRRLRGIINNIQANGNDHEKLLSHEDTFRFLVKEPETNLKTNLVDNIVKGSGKKVNEFKVARALDGNDFSSFKQIMDLGNPEEHLKTYLNGSYATAEEKSRAVETIKHYGGSNLGKDESNKNFYNDIEKHSIGAAGPAASEEKNAKMYSQGELDEHVKNARRIALEEEEKIKAALEKDGKAMENGLKVLRKVAFVAVPVAGVAVVANMARAHGEEKRNKMNEFDRFANSGSNSYTKI